MLKDKIIVAGGIGEKFSSGLRAAAIAFIFLDSPAAAILINPISMYTKKNINSELVKSIERHDVTVDKWATIDNEIKHEVSNLHVIVAI